MPHAELEQFSTEQKAERLVVIDEAQHLKGQPMKGPHELQATSSDNSNELMRQIEQKTLTRDSL